MQITQKKFVLRQEYIVAAFILLLVLVFSLISESRFASFSNLRIILSQAAINGIAVIGLSLCVFMGGVDFSAGAILATCSCLSGMMVNAGMPVILVMTCSILIGFACGSFNGMLIGRFRIAPIIATLASMYILRGVTTVATGGVWISDFPDRFKWPGQTVVVGVPMHFIVFGVLAACTQYFLLNHSTGRKIYAAGGNPETAKLAGLNYNFYRFSVYAVSGGFIGLSGTIYASMVGTVSSNTTGLSTSGDLLAAALIGGLSIKGGKGNIVGACLGILLMQVIRNGLIISKVPEHWADTITGIIIIMALVMNAAETLRDGKGGSGNA